MAKKSEVYDPKLEAVRAQRQAIYESKLKALAYNKQPGYSKKSFRNNRGIRLDVALVETGRIEPDVLKGIMRNSMFAMGTEVAQKRGALGLGSQAPSGSSAEDSEERYADIDHLIRNRQDYEESLAIPRKNFYRVVPEQGARGLVYSVWPMAKGTKTVLFYPSLERATAAMKRLNKTKDPRVTGAWWVPPKRRYTRREVSAWLPSRSVFFSFN